MKSIIKHTGMALTLGITAFSMMGISSKAIDQEYRKPSLSGATQTWIYQGEEFDSSKTKIFADDLEDGDLTASIKVDSNVNTGKTGVYHVNYTVKDKDGNETKLGTTVKVLAKNAPIGEKTIQRTLYTMPDASHLTNIGFNRGYFHDRQNLGIWIPKNQKIEIRIVNAKEFGQNISISFLNNNQKTESSAIIPASGEWVTIGNTYKNEGSEKEESSDSVPFLVTPKNTTVQPILEYKWNDKFNTIPYYRYKSSQDKFFKTWTESKAPYAIIEGSASTFLVPIKDKDNIINSTYGNMREEYRFKTIDEMLEWYAAFVKQYDQFAGLDFYAKEAYNQNVRSKFLVKANINGAGQAYYTYNHSAYNGDSLREYFVKYWLSLHEFAHGYEGEIAGQENPFVETTNNIMGHYFEATYREKDDLGWMLGNRGDLETKTKMLEQKAAQRRQNTTTFAGILSGGQHYDVSLYMFINMLDKIGPKEGTSAMHTMFRKDAYLTGRKDASSDVLAESWGNLSGYNVIPYLESYHITPSGKTKTKIYQQDKPMLYYLKDILPVHAEEVKARKKLSGVYNLISTDEIAGLGYESNLTLKLSIDDFKQVQNKNILIKNGKNIVETVKITEQTMKIKIPAGVYEVELPAPRTQVYEYNDDFLVASEGNAEKVLTYVHKTGNMLADDMQIQFRGLSDRMFASININTETKKLKWRVESGEPHSYFTDKYAEVSVLNSTGKELYTESFNGKQNAEEKDKIIDFPIGSKIRIYHREGSTRLRFISNYSKEDVMGYSPDRDTDTTIYVMTDKGLMKETWNETKRNQVYLSAMTQCSKTLVDTMTQKDIMDPNLFHNEKLLLYNAYQYLSAGDQKEYVKNYGVLVGKEADSFEGYQKLPSNMLSAVADSENAGDGEVAMKAVDGDEQTIWHSNYKNAALSPDIPNNKKNSFTITLSQPTDLGKLEYVPRGGSVNGRILTYELYYSTTADQNDFVKIPLTQNVWANDSVRKSVEFDAKAVKRIQIRALSTAGGSPDTFISAAEFYLYEKYTEPASAGKIYLSGIHQKEDKAQPQVTKDQNVNGQPISLQINEEKTVLTKGIGMSANTMVSYDLTGKAFDTFLAYVGVDSSEDPSKEVIVEIFGDGNLLYRSGFLRSTDSAEPVYVDIRGVAELRIQATGTSQTAVSLGDARFGLAENKKDIVLKAGEKSGFLGNMQIGKSAKGKAQWSSSNPEVASVDVQGIITALSEGTTIISAKYEKETLTCNVRVVSTIAGDNDSEHQNPIVNPKLKDTINNPTVPAPKKVKLKKVKASVKAATVYWKKNADAEGYEVWMRLGKKKYKKVKTVSGKKASIKIKKLKSGKKYSFKIKAYRKNAQKKKVYGAFSNIKSVKIK